MGSEDLRLNSLDRFTKKSPRFLLEEHSHCEVPAGCGGVVLRWINPAAGLPVLLDFFHPTAATLAIDGVPTTSASLLLAPGPHVLAIEFPEPPAEGDALLDLVGQIKIAAAAFQHRDRVIIRSAPHRSWIFTTSTPPAGWMTDPALELPSWKRLVRRPVVAPQEHTEGSYVFRRATVYGRGEPLGVPPGWERRPIHVRKVFTVPKVPSPQ